MVRLATGSNVIVSVILPTYNRATLLTRSISSVLGQRVHQIELIIVDDCSTDNTSEVVGSFNDKRIKYIKPIFILQKVWDNINR